MVVTVSIVAELLAGYVPICEEVMEGKVLVTSSVPSPSVLGYVVVEEGFVKKGPPAGFVVTSTSFSMSVVSNASVVTSDSLSPSVVSNTVFSRVDVTGVLDVSLVLVVMSLLIDDISMLEEVIETNVAVVSKASPSPVVFIVVAPLASEPSMLVDAGSDVRV